jgi:hypothetical protein
MEEVREPLLDEDRWMAMSWKNSPISWCMITFPKARNHLGGVILPIPAKESTSFVNENLHSESRRCGQDEALPQAQAPAPAPDLAVEVHTPCAIASRRLMTMKTTITTLIR